MDGKAKTQNGGDAVMSEKKRAKGKEVVINIPGDKSPKASADTDNSKGSFLEASTEAVSAAGFAVNSVPMSCPSPESPRYSPSRGKPPKISTTNNNMTRRRSLSSVRTNSFAPGGPGEDEEEEICKKVELIKEKRKRVTTVGLIQWVAFFLIAGCLVASLTVDKWEKSLIWGLEIWKWCVLVLVTFSGMMVTNWIMHVIVFFIEMNFLLRKKVLYFVHGLKKSVQVFIWLGLVLLTWALLFNRGIKHSKVATRVLEVITGTLVTVLIGAFLWLLKTLLLKILASNFHVNRFFDRIQESVFNQYILQTLSGPPLIEVAERVGRSPSFGQLSIRSKKKGKDKKETKIIDMGKVHKMKREKVSTWTMKVLVDAIMNSGLSTISKTLDESVNDEGEQADKEITNEMEARAAAYHIFRNVAQPGSKNIEEDDLLQFMIKEEVELLFPLIEGWETGRIDRKALTDWVVKVYKDRKALAHALNDTKTAVKQLNKLVTGILIVVTLILWLLLVEIASTKVIVVLSSQLMVAGFMFKNICKTVFEAIIFVFIMHPFDVGDRCVIDGVPLLVEEMNILTTVFLKLTNEKIYYPNSVLSTKPISNYNRSPDMSDGVIFHIDFMTPIEKIGLLKEKIKNYLEEYPQYWYPNHSVVVQEIENVNKIKIALYFTHTITFQEFGEKNKRRSELVIELKKMFEELTIKCNLLPQEILLSNRGSESTTEPGK
ncbi:Mechanosensitive ion channel protein [Melia azedarach]|uniref:Mechanosensitive ion channel protein n=1 Tax=Melia azedarach TaxID=155640 RepID=A0ACC1XC40_MELAZ|nr:Mechanosensitive ion channel protein [Melia azedarach]